VSWFARLLGRGHRGDAAAPGSSALDQSQPTPAEREILDGLQKLTRVQAKLAMRVEELDSKLEGGFTDLRAGLEEVRPASADDLDWAELLDALDLLAEAARQASAQPALSEGLAAVIARIDRFLSQAGIERLAVSGEAPDGRLFRVVGAETSAALPEGVVARVVRAAVLRGDEILREGEVIVSRRTA
jgi:molecular chaperone GrpE (heat shock protein)